MDFPASLTDICEIDESSPRGSTDSDEDIALLQKWKEECETAATGHAKAYRIYKLLNDTCTTLSITISGASGIATIVLTAAALGPTIFLPLIAGISSIVVGSLVAIGRAMSLEEKMHLHNEHAAAFGEMARDIRQEHTLRAIGKSQFADVGEFIKTISDRIDRLVMHAPSMPC
jgi:hypothetical protein